MPRYRLYFLDASGHIRSVVELSACNNDDEALAEVKNHADGRAMELWDRGRRLHVFPAALSVANEI